MDLGLRCRGRRRETVRWKRWKKRLQMGRGENGEVVMNYFTCEQIKLSIKVF
jgi:hypothetical protein